MTSRAHPAFLWVFVIVLAPLGAVVLISALLLFGVTPSVVFAPGNVIKSLLETCGLHVANRVAVASTAAFFWAVIVAIGLAWERWGRRGKGNLN